MFFTVALSVVKLNRGLVSEQSSLCRWSQMRSRRPALQTRGFRMQQTTKSLLTCHW